jgi:hypothetical protein
MMQRIRSIKDLISFKN